MEDLAEAIKLVRDIHAQLIFADAADDLCTEATHHYLIAVSMVQQALQTMQLADLAQTRELASKRGVRYV